MKRGNRAQATIFIIIAIIIVAVILLFIFTRSETEPDVEIGPEIRHIHNFVQRCILQTGESAVYRIGRTGGYYELSDKSTNEGVAYYYDKGGILIPQKEIIESELSLYMDEMLDICTNDFIDFPDYEITSGEVQSVSKILSKGVSFEVSYPLRIIKDKKTLLLEDFEIEIPVRFLTVYNTANSIVNGMTKEGYCIDCAYNVLKENNLFLQTRDFEDEDIIFYIIDKNSSILDEDFIYIFASKYEKPECGEC